MGHFSHGLLGWILGIAPWPSGIVGLPQWPGDLLGQGILGLGQLGANESAGFPGGDVCLLFVDLFDTIGTLTVWVFKLDISRKRRTAPCQ
jgi:AGZA family xanthine/uracil permease-like MFS transporter